MTDTHALLALEDGTLWPGQPFGALGERAGEVVFNTGMTGYQEVLTDPSYHGQIVVMTQPHIGNYGTNKEDDQSYRAWVAGFVVRAASPVASNWRSTKTLPAYLRDHDVIGITDVDSRALVRHIRDQGAMRAVLCSTNPDPERMIAKARSTRTMSGLDLAQEVTCQEIYQYPLHDSEEHTVPHYHVVAYDFGIKRNILRMLRDRGCQVTVVPAHTPADDVLALKPDGILLSNGPGDPAAVHYAIDTSKELLGHKPIFGICLGYQILALALGAQTYKLKFGHRGSNHPVQHQDTGRVQISTHNHGFAVEAGSLPEGVEITHINLNDGCLEGLRLPEIGAFGVQFHPEASPGPHDTMVLFSEFVQLMANAR